MNKQSDLQEGFYLENWYVEPELGRLTKDKKVFQLEPKIMGVLLCLAESQGKAVRKEYLFSTVWAGVNVTEHVLARAISEIRKVFNDDPHNPQVIQTIPKIGYRLIATISTEIFEEPGENSWSFNPAVTIPQSAIQINSANLLFFFGGLLTMIVLLAMLVLIFARHGSGNFH